MNIKSAMGEYLNDQYNNTDGTSGTSSSTPPLEETRLGGEVADLAARGASKEERDKKGQELAAEIKKTKMGGH